MHNFFSDDVYERSDIIGIYISIATLGLTMVLSIASAVLAFINTFGVYLNWFYGPPMLYLCCLFAGK